MAFKSENEEVVKEQCVLRIWQIDSFEGGKGSRADYLQKIGEQFSKNRNCYVSVTSLSADAARMNFDVGNTPDLISYGAGMYGIESKISNYSCWCHGGYCFLTLDTNSDFSDIKNDNTVINEGKDNLTRAAALMCGLQNCKYEKSTGAYVKLINGEYKYLLGTQRDIFRLKTRGVSFNVKPVTQFNDLYQNISVITGCGKEKIAQDYITFLIQKSNEVTKLGLMSNNTVFEDEMKILNNIDYEHKLTSPISEQIKKQIENIIADENINMLKNLFN